MNILNILFLSLLILPISLAWYGYVLSLLWLWFAVDVFGVPALSFVEAAGISLIVWFFKPHKYEKPKTDEQHKDEFYFAIIMAALNPLYFLAIGYIVKSIA